MLMFKNIVKLLNCIWFCYLVLVALLCLTIAIYTHGRLNNIYETNIIINLICNYAVLFTYLIVPFNMLLVNPINIVCGLEETFQKY